jgi:uncharacterized protein
MIELASRYVQQVWRIAQNHVPYCNVYIFGSYARGTACLNSDVDLAILGREPLGIEKMLRLKEAYENSDLPFLVDVVDWSEANPRFKAMVESQGMIEIGEIAGQGAT